MKALGVFVLTIGLLLPAHAQTTTQPPIGTQERKPAVLKEADSIVAPRTTQPPFSNSIDIVNPKGDPKAQAGK